jgi:lipopolysaccharide export LptBFGC system permease protein LptF
MARVLAFVAIGPMIGGMLLPENDRVALVAVPLWAVFGIGLAVTLAVAVATASRDPSSGGRRLALVCGVALVAFWVLLVLPGINSDVGFLLTLAAVLGCTAVWLIRPPGARWPR